MRLALVKQTRMTHSGSAAKYFVYESGCGEKVLFGRVKHEINWSRFLITEGMVQLPRGSARVRKVAKQQISVTYNSRARDEVKFSHKSRKKIGLLVSLVSISSISSILKKKTSVARLRGPHPFTFGKPSAGHQKRARGPILWPPLL